MWPIQQPLLCSSGHCHLGPHRNSQFPVLMPTDKQTLFWVIELQTFPSLGRGLWSLILGLCPRVSAPVTCPQRKLIISKKLRALQIPFS